MNPSSYEMEGKKLPARSIIFHTQHLRGITDIYLEDLKILTEIEICSYNVSAAAAGSGVV